MVKMKKGFLIKVNIAGFKFITRELGGTDVYGSDVSLDDPYLRIEEIRKELDINKLIKQTITLILIAILLH